MPSKVHLYQHETYFREGLSDVEDVFGEAAADRLRRSALLIVKPDAVAGAKLGAICTFLNKHDFSIVAVERFSFTRLSARELWRYQLTLATLDRLAVNDCVLLAGPAMMLLLRSDGDQTLPATVRLSTLKGAADVKAQMPGTLRSVLGQRNRLCSMIHCADEPADLVRELGLLVDRRTRRRLLTALATGEMSDADNLVLNDALKLDSRGGRSFDSRAAVLRVCDAVHKLGAREPAKSGQIDVVLRYLEQMRKREIIAWRTFASELDALELNLDPWDVAILGSNFILEDEPGASKMLVNPDPATWVR